MMKKKIDWVNYSKAIGIILVVFGHVWRGINAKGLLTNNFAFLLIDDLVYSFHMPLFFLISGFFVSNSFSKYNNKDLVNKKAKTLMYTYFVWSTVQILVNIILSNYTNNSTDFWAILKLVYLPISPFWYLYSLFLMYLLYVFTSSINIKLNLFLSIILYLVPNTGISLVENLFNFYIYFVLGSLFFNFIVQYNERVQTLFFSIPLFFLSFFIYKYILKVDDIRFYFIPAIIGSIIVFNLSKVLSNNKILNLLGNNSLIIFLLHIFFTAGTRIFLFNILGVSSVTLHLFLGLIIGLIGPIIFNYFYVKLNLKGLFVYPF
ncbi:acyltransferase family protein [Polaribacter sp.]|nr:acyltransferase family protein [Polaribacter sp.]